MRFTPSIVNDTLLLQETKSYSLRSGVTVDSRNIRTNKFGLETINFIAVIPRKTFTNRLMQENTTSLTLNW